MGLQVMIVDDTPDQLQLMRAVFGMVAPALKIKDACSGSEALTLLRSGPEHRPSVVLLDLRMPGMTGIDVLREMKADPALKSIPVCIFSNGDVQGDICNCYEFGASFYFKKPAGLDALKRFAERFHDLWFQFASLC